jgi:hypothetical protein
MTSRSPVALSSSLVILELLRFDANANGKTEVIGAGAAFKNLV